jgi:hypothetical protein
MKAKPGPVPRTLTVRQRRSLEAAARRAQAADERAATARAELVSRIVDVYDDGAGASIREIAAAVELSSARVGGLLQREARR